MLTELQFLARFQPDLEVTFQLVQHYFKINLLFIT